MDRRVKERLIGATILVVLIILIVPELLSGPHPQPVAAPEAREAQQDPTRIVTVDLATSKATPAADPSAEGGAAAVGAAAVGAGTAQPDPASTVAPTTTAPAAAAATAAAASPPRGAAAAETPGAPALAPAPAPAPVPPPAAAAVEPAPHHWAVQLGSFASSANAEKLVRKLRPHEPSVYVSSAGRGAGLRYRVRVGPLADRAAAERAAARFKKEGVAASVVPP